MGTKRSYEPWTFFWIEEETGEVRSRTIYPEEATRRGNTMEEEVRIKYAHMPLDLVGWPAGRITERHAQDRIAMLRQKAASLKATKGEGTAPGEAG